MLWLYADTKDVPEKVGPLRSARPSYVKFSKFFDAIFIHWGGSHSTKNYTGGYETIKKEKVNNIDGMSGGELFSRDTTRKVSSEHRGVLNGKKIKKAIEKKGYRTELKDSSFSPLHFNSTVAPAGADGATSVGVKFSDRTDTRSRINLHNSAVQRLNHNLFELQVEFRQRQVYFKRHGNGYYLGGCRRQTCTQRCSGQHSFGQQG